MKKILFLTNYSDHSSAIYRYALKLGKQFGAEVHLAHVFGLLEQVSSEQEGSSSFIELELNKDDYLDQKYAEQYVELHNYMLRETPTEYQDLTFDFHVQLGFTVDQITTLVQKIDVELIVMGIHQRGRIADSLFGNIAMQMIDAVPCDLFLVPDHGIYYNTIKKILYATDLATQDIEDIRLLLEWKKTFKSRLHVIHVCDNKQNKAVAEHKIDQWKTIFKKEINAGKLEFRVQTGLVENEIQKYLKFIGANMVCLSQHNRSHWPAILEPSLTKDLARKVDIPILILKHLKRMSS